MKNSKLMGIVFLNFILSVFVVFLSPRFDILTVFGFLIINIFLLMILNLYEKKKSAKNKEKIEDIYNLINDLNVNTENYEVEDDEYGRLRDEIIKIIQEREIAAKEAIKNRDILKRYIEDMTHQIKTPLTGILLMTDLLEESEEKDIYISYIRNEITRLYQLSDILLKLASLDSGILLMNYEDFQIKELLAEVKLNLEPLFFKENYEIKIIGEDFILNRDRQWTYEAIFNIVKNGLESDNNRKVEIELAETGIFQSVIVRDFSCGISRENLQKMYQRFYKLNPKSKGFGIGLPMAKTIMEKQSGDLLYFKEKNSNYFELRFYK